MSEESKASEILAQLLQSRLSKGPALAEKQARLLRKLSESSSSEQPADSRSAEPSEPPTQKPLPDAPVRASFSSQEEFEESMGYWQSHIGRIKAMVNLARRSKDSR